MSWLAWVLGIVAAGLGLRLALHLRQLTSLRAWLRSPELHRLPRGRGIWEDALAELHRYLKRREAEHEALAGTLARFRAAARALPDGVVILDPHTHIEWVNPTAARHFGIDARRDVGQPVMNLIRNPEFIAYLDAADFRQARLLRASFEATLSVRIVEFGEDRKLLISRDVTAEERLETMRRDFVANVSHELKTPVTVLAGFVETLADETMDFAPDERRRFLGLMAEQANRMQRLVEDLLTLSSLESSAGPRDEQPIEVQALVEQLAEEARALSGDRHEVRTTADREARLFGSPGELHSAFSNLVSNAVRYTPEGGRVEVAWRLADGRGVFSVTDSGIGIDARHLPRLTERFYRIDSGRSRESGGTGLGLAIVKHVLTRHQASLEVTSQPGRGSTFSAVFPAGRLLPPDEDKQAA